jgi:nucleoside-diphosphate-sugar epimerase
MKILLFGGTGMVGQGVLRECLRDSQVEAVLSVVRAADQQHPKLKEMVMKDLFEFPVVAGLCGYGACIWGLGVSSAGISEPDYTRITYDLTLRIAQFLLKQNPEMTFEYVSAKARTARSGGGERGRA